MIRFFVQPEQIQNGAVILDADDAHHLRTVLQAKAGDAIAVLDGTGQEWPATLETVGKARAEARLGEPFEPGTEPAVKITVAQALPKITDKMEQVLQRGTEIGVSHFWAFASERSLTHLIGERHTKRLTRWGSIVKTAAEQAHRAILPTVRAEGGLTDVLAAGDCDLTLFAHTEPRLPTLRDVLSGSLGGPLAPNNGGTGEEGQPGGEEGQPHRVAPTSGSPLLGRGGRILLLIGPESGFTDAEAKQARAAGARAVSLGPRILRTETAAMVMAAQIVFAWE